MCVEIEIFWKRGFVFCLAFGLGIFVTGFFIPIETLSTHKPIICPIEVRESQELKKDVPLKPLCKKYADNFIEDLVRLKKEKLEFNQVLQSKTLSRKQKETYLQKLKKVETKIKDYEKNLNRGNDLPRESKPLHNLVFVEKCVEY